MIRRCIAVLAVLLLALPAVAGANPLAGTWRLAADGQTVEIELSADGRFARRDIGPDGRATTVTGHWTLADQAPWLRLVIEDWSPRQACGLTGCAEIRMLPGETYRYALRGGDTLLLEDTGGRLAFRRAG
ncbi:hypothetical protein GWK16_21425 [Roseomonas sp. JC162]|uniref:Uncharacterized protein n=1 Tax=Neoroseomonas marina TaxID=1232220 RepID=A0A848EKA2_9PROT|nr:hypothetical protein [Neoroseomonas marina]NMJ43823.1 hypothetical protein [Neoroseomonas marina]